MPRAAAPSPWPTSPRSARRPRPATLAGHQDELSFAPGQTERTIEVGINGDVLFEADESFTLVLSDPTNATLTDAQGTATITDDDTEPAQVVLPSSFTVLTGEALSGNASSLGADDNNYLVVRSTKTGTKVAIWFASFTGVDNSISTLHASYKGKSSSTCTQVISIFRWTDASWIQLDSRSIGDAEVEAADLSPSGTLADYVSGTSGAGEVRVRVSCSTSGARFDLSADRLQATRGIGLGRAYPGRHRGGDRRRHRDVEPTGDQLRSWLARELRCRHGGDAHRDARQRFDVHRVVGRLLRTRDVSGLDGCPEVGQPPRSRPLPPRSCSRPHSPL